MTDGYDDPDDARDPDEVALRARLRTSDPARSLPPVDADRVRRLLEETMHTDAEQEPGQETQQEAEPATGQGAGPIRETGTRDRSRLTWLVAAAAVLLIAGAAVFAVLGHDQAQAPSAGGGGGSTTPTSTRLSAPGQAAYRARCMVPSAAALSRQTVAFDGTVRSIAAGTVTLVPTHFYAGDSTELVQVEAPRADLQALVTAVHFQQGHRYLVSASNGTVTVCGFSAPWSRGLAAIYNQAFGGR